MSFRPTFILIRGRSAPLSNNENEVYEDYFINLSNSSVEWLQDENLIKIDTGIYIEPIIDHEEPENEVEGSDGIIRIYYDMIHFKMYSNPGSIKIQHKVTYNVRADNSMSVIDNEVKYEIVDTNSIVAILPYSSSCCKVLRQYNNGIIYTTTFGSIYDIFKENIKIQKLLIESKNSCEPVEIKINTEDFYTADSGENVNIVVRDTDDVLVGSKDGAIWRVPASVGDSLPVDFTVDEDEPETYEEISFTDTTSGATSWLWSFGDGNFSTLQNPTHKYKKVGTFTVTLFASNGTSEGVEVKNNFIVVTLQADYTTNLLAAFDSENWTESSGYCSGWNDSSGNAFHITQGTSGNRPEIISSELNGYDILRFDGINDSLIGAHASMSMATPICVAILMKSNQPYSGNQIYFSEQSTGSAHKRFWKPANTRGYQYRDSASGNLEYITGMPDDTWALHIINFDAGSSNYQCYNHAETGAASLTTMASGTGFILGNTAIGGALMDVAEMRIYSAALTQANKDIIAERMMAKFDLSKYEK